MKIVTVFALALVALESASSIKAQGDDGSGLVCEITPAEIASLGPLLTKLGLAMTVDGVKQLLLQLDKATGGLLLSPAVIGSDGLTALLNRLVVALVGEPLDLDDIVRTLAVILDKTIQCVANPLP